MNELEVLVAAQERELRNPHRTYFGSRRSVRSFAILDQPLVNRSGDPTAAALADLLVLGEDCWLPWQVSASTAPEIQAARSSSDFLAGWPGTYDLDPDDAFAYLGGRWLGEEAMP